MDSVLTAYIDANERAARAHMGLVHASMAFYLTFVTRCIVEPLLAVLPPSAAQRAISAVRRSSFGAHVVIETNVPQWNLRA